VIGALSLKEEKAQCLGGRKGKVWEMGSIPLTVGSSNKGGKQSESRRRGGEVEYV